MSKNKNQHNINTTTNINKPWPKDCLWPEPKESFYWEAEASYSMPLDDDAQYLMDIKDYMDDLVSEGRLNPDYTINPDYWIDAEKAEDETDLYDEPWASWEPESGEEFWSKNGFDFECWSDEMAAQLNNLKLPLPSPVDDIRCVIGYEFVNENILRQAFTRRAFGIEYGTGDGEVLEFYGDSVLNTVITREMSYRASMLNNYNLCYPVESHYTEGELTRGLQRYVSCEYLSARATELGLDKFILYGSGEEVSDASKEDMMEALIGAVAVDSGWDWKQLEAVVDRLICFQISKDLLKPGYYEMFNSWHQRKFGCMPDYETEAVCSGGNGSSVSSQYRQYNCTLRYQIPENDKGIRTAQRVNVQKETRSGARELAAELAYRFVVNNGFWVSLADAEIEPKLEDAINQLQELYQKKYVGAAPQYEFEEQALFDGANPWYCSCTCGGVEGWGRAPGKTKAKKKAAFMVLVRLMKSSGLGSEELEKAMWETM